jgi:hypothetical protein
MVLRLMAGCQTWRKIMCLNELLYPCSHVCQVCIYYGATIPSRLRGRICNDIIWTHFPRAFICVFPRVSSHIRGRICIHSENHRSTLLLFIRSARSHPRWSVIVDQSLSIIVDQSSLSITLVEHSRQPISRQQLLWTSDRWPVRVSIQVHHTAIQVSKRSGLRATCFVYSFLTVAAFHHSHQSLSTNTLVNQSAGSSCSEQVIAGQSACPYWSTIQPYR